MVGKIFRNIIDFLKAAAPVSIGLNIAMSAVLIIVGLLLLLSKRRQTKAKRVGGWACVSVSILLFLGAISNWFFSRVVF